MLTTHYDHGPGAREAYFGFLLPVRWAVWAELLIIQLMVPNASFIGHLGRQHGLAFSHKILLNVQTTFCGFSFKRWNRTGEVHGPEAVTEIQNLV